MEIKQDRDILFLQFSIFKFHYDDVSGSLYQSYIFRNCKNAAFVSENNNFLFKRSKPGTKAQIIRLRSAGQLLYHFHSQIFRQRVVIRIDENFSIKKIKNPTTPHSPQSSLSPKYAWRHRDTSDIWTSMELQTKMGGKLPVPDFISSLLSVLGKP